MKRHFLILMVVLGWTTPAPLQAQPTSTAPAAAIQIYLTQMVSPLAHSQEGGVRAADLIARYSDAYQVDPALLLATMDASTGIVSDPQAPALAQQQPFGAQGPRGLTAQLAWVVGSLVRGRGQQAPLTLRFRDGLRVTLDPADHQGDWFALRRLLAIGRTHAAWLMLDEQIRARQPVIAAQLATETPQVSVVVDSHTFVFLQPPTISAAHYAAVLHAAGSPAAPEAHAMYQALVAAGIDPAIELAFARKETAFGLTGVGVPGRHNLHGITCNGWDHIYGGRCNGRFSTYPHYTASVQAWAALIRAYSAAGLTTPRQALWVYAPASENHTAYYIAQVEQWVTAWRASAAR